MKAKSMFLLIIFIISLVIISNDQRIIKKNTESSNDVNEENIPIIQFNGDESGVGIHHPGLIEVPIPDPDPSDDPPD